MVVGMAQSRHALRPPVIAGYTHLRPLGQGGFADVFLYQQDMPRRQVAVKVLHASVGARAAAALAAEADAMAALSAHPAIVTIHQASVSADGRPYLVMEHCPGSLANRYRAELIPVPEVLDIGIRIAAAVETAHRVGLLHRDIKPSNILVTAFDHPVLSDFGVATAVAAGEGEDIALSPPWSAPEVVDGMSSGTVASEVWSLTATVYTLLAQRSPFAVPDAKADPDRLRARIVAAKYRPTGRFDVPPALEEALARGLRRLPEDRYSSARGVGEALQDIQRTLSLPVTALDLPGESWAAPPDLTGSPDRLPHGAQVAAPNARPARATPPAPPAQPGRQPHRRSGAGPGWGIGLRVAATVVAALAVAAAVVWMVV